MMNELKPLLGKLSLFAKDKFNFSRPPRLFLKKDSANSKMPLGKTAHYDPSNQSVTLYISSRHPKDILRSYAHELIHHIQNLRGDLSPEKMGSMGSNYAQDNDHMRNMEKEAYLKGNMCFRDWEDNLSKGDKIKYKLAESKFLKENKKVNKDTLKNLIRKVLKEQPDPLTGAARSRVKDPVARAKAFINQAERTKIPGYKDTAAYKNALATIKANPSQQQINQDRAKRRKANDKKIKADRDASVKLKKDRDEAIRKINNPRNNAEGFGVSISTKELEKFKDLTDVHRKAYDDRQAAIKKINTDTDNALAKIYPHMIPQLAHYTGPKKQSDVDVDTAIASTDPSALSFSDPSDARSISDAPAEPQASFIDSPVSPVEPAKPAARKLSRREIIRKRRQQARILRDRDIVASVGNLRELQKRLVNLGHMPETTPRGNSSIDGKYGQMTHDAIVKLQNSVGIEGDDADGVAGPATVRAIRGNPAVQMAFKLAARRKLNEFNNKEIEEMKEAKTAGESKNIEENAFVLAADAAADAGKKSFEFPKGSGKMHKVRLKKGGDTIQDEKETKSEGAQPPPHPYDIEDQYGSMGSRTQGAAAPVQDVLKMISNISSDGKITGEELVAAGKKLMQQAQGSNYRDSREYRDDYAANKEQYDDLSAYQNMEESNGEIERDKVSSTSLTKAIVKKAIEKADAISRDALQGIINNPKDNLKMLASYAGDNKDLFTDEGGVLQTVTAAAQELQKEKLKESSSVQTPEQENTIYENRFNKRNNLLFDKLINKWTK